MTSVSVQVDRDAIRAMVERRVKNGCVEGADFLANRYMDGLTENVAPRHSRAGEIPHAYFGWVPGGFGPVNGKQLINNTPKQGFVRNQSDFLAMYIRAARTKEGGGVGFLPSHVQNRYMNYLLGWDEGRYKGETVPRRPWVKPLYLRHEDEMREAVKKGVSL